MDAAKAKAAETLDAITDKVKSVGESFETVKQAAAAFAAAGVGGEVVEKIGQLAERAENIKDLAEQFNTTTTSLQGLQIMAAQTGVNSERLQRSMTTLQAEIAKAGEAGGTSAQKFEALGLSAEQL